MGDKNSGVTKDSHIIDTWISDVTAHVDKLKDFFNGHNPKLDKELYKKYEHLDSYFKSEAGKVQITLNKKNKLMEEVEHLHAQVALEKLKWDNKAFSNRVYILALVSLFLLIGIMFLNVDKILFNFHFN